MSFSLPFLNYMALVAAVACFAGAPPVTLAAKITLVQSKDANLLASTVLAAGTIALVPNSANVTKHTLASAGAAGGTASGIVKYCAGTFTDTGTGSGMTSGVVLSTGWVGDLVDPNNNSAVTGQVSLGDYMTLPNGKIGYDPCKLQFTFQCPAWATSVQVQYVFASEDYATRTTTASAANQSDAIFILLNGLTATKNIATVPGTTSNSILSSQTINNRTNSQYFRDNSQGTLAIQANGLTQILTATGPAKANGTNTIEFIVADVGNPIRDSWLLIKPGSLTCLGCPSTFLEPRIRGLQDYQVGDIFQLTLSVGYVPVRVDWGDGSPPDALLTHQYMQPAKLTITVTSAYANRNCSNQTFTGDISQTVKPRTCTYPTIKTWTLVGNNATIILSSLTTTTGSFLVSIDWDSGAAPVSNKTKTTYFTLLNQEKLYNVKVTFSDGKGCWKDILVPIYYCPSAPSPSFSSLSISEGRNLTVSISNTSGYLLAVNWGDNNNNNNNSSMSMGGTLYRHVYDGTRNSTVTVRVYHPTNGCQRDTSRTVFVRNVQPTVQIISGPSAQGTVVTTNDTVTVRVSCNDAGATDALGLYMSWGDQPEMLDGKYIAAPASRYCQDIAFTHRYASKGTYEIVASVLDHDDAYTTTALPLILTVVNPSSTTRSLLRAGNGMRGNVDS